MKDVGVIYVSSRKRKIWERVREEEFRRWEFVKSVYYQGTEKKIDFFWASKVKRWNMEFCGITSWATMINNAQKSTPNTCSHLSVVFPFLLSPLGGGEEKRILRPQLTIKSGDNKKGTDRKHMGWRVRKGKSRNGYTCPFFWTLRYLCISYIPIYIYDSIFLSRKNAEPETGDINIFFDRRWNFCVIYGKRNPINEKEAKNFKLGTRWAMLVSDIIISIVI